MLPALSAEPLCHAFSVVGDGLRHPPKKNWEPCFVLGKFVLYSYRYFGHGETNVIGP